MRKPFVKPPFVPTDKIIELAKRPEGFNVSWRWRDDRLRRRCFILVKKGVLRCKRRTKGCNVFFAVEPASPCLK